MTGINKTTHLTVLITDSDQLKYTGENFRDAALAAWRRPMKLHVSAESNGAESPA
ncbi:hypothetical protein VNKP15269_C55400 (plasmid) [Klebsiella pneumoniae]|nr:hypothetical protein VNKP15269_C55400 [Klebsiella pneumoniae]